MSYTAKKPWVFNKPKTCKPAEKLFALDKPYTGVRLNKAKLVRAVTDDDLKHSKALSALGDPIPTEWSWRNLGQSDPKYKGKIEPARDQGGCGSCWAFSMSVALGDRYSIKYGIDSSYLSPSWLMSTTYNLMGTASNTSCDEGGDPYMASKWLEKNTTKKERCWPYNLVKEHGWVAPPKNLPNDCCANCCDSKKDKAMDDLYRVKPNSTKSLIVLNNGKIDPDGTIAAIQREIMSNGPVVCGFQVFDDFMVFWNKSAPKGGIYVCNGKGDSGGHAVTITGWGQAKLPDGKTMNYWELRNSWGNSGDEGYCKVAFSTSEKKNKILELDVPLKYEKDRSGNELYTGGMFTFQPGALPMPETRIPIMTTPKAPIRSMVQENFKYRVPASSKVLGVSIPNAVLVLLIILMIVAIVVAIYLVSKKRKM